MAADPSCSGAPCKRPLLEWDEESLSSWKEALSSQPKVAGSRYREAFPVEHSQEHQAVFDDHVSADASIFPLCDGGMYSFIADKRVQRRDERFLHW